jgi:hypothetical protein
LLYSFRPPSWIYYWEIIKELFLVVVLHSGSENARRQSSGLAIHTRRVAVHQ